MSNQDDTTQTTEQKIMSYVQQLEYNDQSQVWEIPESIQSSLTEAEAFAVMAEKRRRDHQSSYTRERDKTIKLEAELQALKKQKELLIDTVSSQRTVQLLDEMEVSQDNYLDMRNQIDEVSIRAKREVTDIVEEATADEVAEAQRRANESLLNVYASTHTNVDFSKMDDFMPVSMQRKLDSGEISYTDYLDDYVKRNTVSIHNPTPPSMPSLNSVGGSSAPIKQQNQRPIGVADIL